MCSSKPQKKKKSSKINIYCTSVKVFPAKDEACGNSEEDKRERVGWTNTLRKRHDLSVRVNTQVAMDRTRGWAGRRNKNKPD